MIGVTVIQMAVIPVEAIGKSELSFTLELLKMAF